MKGGKENERERERGREGGSEGASKIERIGGKERKQKVNQENDRL